MELICLHALRPSFRVNSQNIQRRAALRLRGIENVFRVRRPDVGSNPLVYFFCSDGLLTGLSVIQHQPEAVGFESRPLLGAVGDVAAIGRIERRRVAGGIVGGDVFGRASRDRDDPQIVVGGSSRILVVIRGVANLLPIGREGVVVLPAEREDRSVVVTRGKINWESPDAGRELRSSYKDVSPFALVVGVPMPIEQLRENLRLDL